MSFLATLWLPILLSAVFVFVVSCIIHMALPWHKGDYTKLPEEDKVRAALGPFATPPGDYMVPMATGGEMRSPEFQEKLRQGPVMMLTVLPNGPFAMGATMAQWFLYTVVLSVITAYATIHAVPLWGGHRIIFRIAGVVAFMGYAGALWPQSIWYRKSWCVTFKSTIDGLVYACVTAGTFAWLWPH